MKQRIRVTAICKKDDEVLLLKRAGGRFEGATNYELPTGKIVFGEQPEEAMARVIYENLGVQASKIQLTDVVTFTGLRNSSEQGNLFIVFEILSVFKNMIKCKLPIPKKFQKKLEEIFKEFTGEMDTKEELNFHINEIRK